MTCRSLFCALLVSFASVPSAVAAEPAAERPVRVARAQAPSPSVSATQAPPPAVELSFPEKRWRRDIVRIGNDLTIADDDGANAVTMIGGNAVIDGRIAHDVVVILGQAEIGPTALIDGSVQVVGGTLTIAEGARLRRDLIVVGGRLDAPPSFVPGGDFTVIGPQVFGHRFAGVFDWLERGLLWGRFIVPNLGWVWLVVALFYVGYLLLGVMFERPIREITETLEARPFTALVVGFLVTLVAGPVCVLLAVSVIGIAVVPLVLVGLCVAWAFGRIGTARWIGRSLLGPAELPRADMARNFTVGFAVLTIAYMVPIVGLAAWTLLSVFGVGASALSFLSAYRRETPIFPRAPRAATVTVVPTAAVAPVGSSLYAASPLGDAADVPPAGPASPAASAVIYGPNDLVTFPKASFRDRLASGALDAILLLITIGLFDPLFDDNRGFGLALAYFVGCWVWKGATLGGIICQLRVVRIDNQPIRFVDGLVRGLSAIFSVIVAGLGFLWILRDPDRQAWHDRIAGTYVVKVPRNWPI